MMIPPPELAEELTDVCSKCGLHEQPVAVQGHADTPTAAYKCMNDGTIWFSDWHRTFKKVLSDVVTPTLVASQPNGLDLSQNPSCQQCQSPLGQPHAPACPYSQYPSSPEQIGQVKP